MVALAKVSNMRRTIQKGAGKDRLQENIPPVCALIALKTNRTVS
jgi:hypothetical protein